MSINRIRGWLLDLDRSVRNVLGQSNGGTGNPNGYGTAVVLPFSNGDGATISIGTIVTLKGSYDDNRVVTASTADATNVIGIVVGSYVDDDGVTFQAVAPADNVQAAVMVAGAVEVRIGTAVTRNQYAYVNGSGAAKSSATLSAGAFGIFVESASSGTAYCVLGVASAGGATTLAFATPSLTLGTANGAGAAATVIRSDATILAFDATTPAALTLGGSGAVGAATVAARRDHGHAVTGALDALSDVTAPSPATGDKLSWSGSAWVNSAGGADPNIWRPLMDGAIPGTIILNGANGEAIMAYGPA